MALNRKYEGFGVRLPNIVATHPATPSSGQPARLGVLTGIALTSESAAGFIVLDETNSVWELPVKGVNDGGNVAVAAGDALYYVDADIGSGTGFLSKKTSGIFFGIALEAVNSGSTTSIDVFHQTPSIDSNPLAEISGAEVAVVPASNVDAGVVVMHRYTLTAGANADSNITLNNKFRVTGVKVVLKGAGTAGSLVTVKNGATAITNAINVATGSDKDVFVESSIDDASHEVAAAGTLRVSKASTGGDFPGAEVYVTGVLVS